MGGGGREEIDIEGVVVEGGWRRGQGRIFFWNLTPFFDFKFKNTSNLIFLGFKVPFERFLFKNLKTGLTFWHTV